jgi:hypothetical protein
LVNAARISPALSRSDDRTGGALVANRATTVDIIAALLRVSRHEAIWTAEVDSERLSRSQCVDWADTGGGASW